MGTTRFLGFRDWADTPLGLNSLERSDQEPRLASLAAMVWI